MFSRLTPTPVVTTIHGFSSDRILPVYQAYDDIAHYVSISDSDRHPSLTYLGTVHHGIELDRFTPGPGDGGYLLFLGRIHPDKGTATAIDVARRAGWPLVIAGVVHDQDYFEREVAPHVDGSAVSYVGPVGPQERDRLLGGAAALLHLIDFDEPFGLSVVESFAAGTPVIAARRGSMPELVTHGATGFLVPGPDEAVRAVARLGEIDRAACRREAETRFSADRMVWDYERLFADVAGRPRGGPPGAGGHAGGTGSGRRGARDQV